MKILILLSKAFGLVILSQLTQKQVALDLITVIGYLLFRFMEIGVGFVLALALKYLP
jgi:hypothetical protein